MDPKAIRLLRRPDGGLRLTLAGDRSYTDVRAVRAAPLSDPEHNIALLDARGEEICSIEEPGELDESSRQALHEELRRRYLVFTVGGILALRQEAGVAYLDFATDHGRRECVIRNVQDSTRFCNGRRLVLEDAVGDRFEIADLAALDRKSTRLLRRVLPDAGKIR